MRYSLAISVTICSLLVACTKHPCERNAALTLGQARRDFRELRELILNGHPFNFATRTEVMASFDSQYLALVDGMTILEFYRAIAPAVSAVKCGHTRLSLPDCVQKDIILYGGSFPFDIKVTRDSLVIVEAYDSGLLVPRGSVVLSINGVPAPEIIGQMKSGLYSDGQGETFKYFLMNQNFARHYLEMIEDTADFEIAFVAPDTKEIRSASVGAMSQAEVRDKHPARSTDHPGSRLVETVIDSSNAYATLRIRFFDFYDNLSDFTERIDTFFRNLADIGVPSLVLDLRGNDGGGPHSSAYLLGYLIGEPFSYYAPHSTFLFHDLRNPQAVPDYPFHGSLYVLIDGGCFSTTGHFLSVLRTHGKGLFIGEETGGSYICNGGYTEHRLTHTGIELLLPHTAFIANARGLRPEHGITPNVFVDYSTMDLNSGQDPVLGAALAIIRDGN